MNIPVNVGFISNLCDAFMVVYCTYIDGVVREVNVRVLGNGLDLLSANGGRFEINQLLFCR